MKRMLSICILLCLLIVLLPVTALAATTMEQTQTVPVKFDADLWLATVDHVTVNPGAAVFTFKGGMEITEEI